MIRGNERLNDLNTLHMQLRRMTLFVEDERAAVGGITPLSANANNHPAVLMPSVIKLITRLYFSIAVIQTEETMTRADSAATRLFSAVDSEAKPSRYRSETPSRGLTETRIIATAASAAGGEIDAATLSGTNPTQG